MTENALKNNAKVVLTEHGISPTLLLGAMPTSEVKESKPGQGNEHVGQIIQVRPSSHVGTPACPCHCNQGRSAAHGRFIDERHCSTVYLVDNRDVVRKGLRFYLTARPEIEIVGEAGDAARQLRASLREVPDRPDGSRPAALPGALPSDQGGIQATRQIRQASPHTQVVVLTSYTQDELIFAAIKAGALSYLLKDADASTVLDAIQAAGRGEVVLTPTDCPAAHARGEWSSEAARDPASRAHAARARVLQLIAQGQSNAEIAARSSS